MSGALFHSGAAAGRPGDNDVHEGYAGESFSCEHQVTDFPGGISGLHFPWACGEDVPVLKILIVEDDSQLAVTLKYLVEDNPRYRVVAIADDADSAIAAAEDHQPDLVLLDLHLARASTGFPVAVRLGELGAPRLFVSSQPPRFPMPDLPLGSPLKPFN